MMETVVGLLFLIGGCLGCNFPLFLQNPPDQLHEEWRYMDTQEGIINPVYSAYNIRVTRGLLVAKSVVQDTSIYKHESFNWTCVNAEADGKYSVHSSGTKNEYFCVEFVKHSDSVVQFRRSTSEPSLSEVKCGNDDLSLDPWPLLKNVYRSIECPSLGGFWVDYYDNLNTYLCGKIGKSPTRMEFSCTQGEGIFVNFDGCSDVRESLLSISNEDKGHIYCRAVWQQDNYTFIVASDQALNWIIRYETDQYEEEELDILIMKDLAAETKVIPRITRNYIKAHLSKQNMNSLCLDYRPETFCGDVDCTDKDLSKHCQKYCNRCHRDERKFCNFDTSIRGDWLAVKRDDRVDKVHIDDRWFNFTNYESLRCYRSRHHGNDTKLVKLSNNGCSPRYFCLKTLKKVPSVLKYQIGMPLGWIVRNKEICAKKQFEHNQDPASWKHFSHTGISRPLVNRNALVPVDCNALYMIHVKMEVTPGVTCGVIITPKRATILGFRYENCSDSITKPDTNYLCLYSQGSSDFPDVNKVLVAAKDNDPSMSVCIAIYKTPGNHYKFIIVPSGECFINGDTFYNIKYDPKGAHYLKWPVYDVTKISQVGKPKKVVQDEIDRITSTTTTPVIEHIETEKSTKKVEKSHEKEKSTVSKTEGSYEVHKNTDRHNVSSKNTATYLLCFIMIIVPLKLTK